MPKRLLLLFLFFFLCSISTIWAQGIDSTRSKMPAFYNWTDVYLNRFNYIKSPALTLNPNQLKTTVLFDPTYSNFSISEKVSPQIDSKLPEVLSFNDYSSIQNAMLRKSILRDIERAQDGYTDFTGKRIRPLLETSKIFDRIFGDKLPEFKPNGYLQVMAYHYRMRNDNPTNIYNRDRSYFDFDQQIAINFDNFFNNSTSRRTPNMGSMPNSFPGGTGSLPSLPTDILNNGRIQDIKNVMRIPGQINEKVNIAGTFDTKSAFQMDNRMKINFKNDPEDILQVVELGNVSFPNRSQLIPGVQNLLGAKVGLKFGRLDITGVVAQQNSRTKSIILNGGSQNRRFEVRADNYEENRHFFLAQFFKDNYEKSLRNLPIITSGVVITRVEAYVTNRTYSVETNRNILAVNDLGESKPFNTSLVPNDKINAADNLANNLYDALIKGQSMPSRDIDQITTAVNSFGLHMGSDYEILRGAKKLQEADFELNPELGYISLRTPLRNDEVLAVAYEYTYRDPRTNRVEKYRVGELTEDYVNRSESDAIVFKLLKSSNIRNNLQNPMWNLMMKNVYNLGQGQLKQDGFQMRIIYKDDNTGMDVPYLADIENLKNTPLLYLFGLDRLNYNNELIRGKQGGDGNFDFIEGVTVNTRYGRIIFPVLEPFGSNLEKTLESEDKRFSEKYVFNDLYRKTLSDAQQNTLKNKFYLQGTFIVGGGEIPLPLGASASSVRVYAGGIELKQGTDYMVDTQMGTVRLTNQSMMNSGKTIRVDYEETDLFQTQIRRFFGLRMDYTFNRNLRIGATFEDLRENTPGFTTRTALGNEPVNNSIYGFDLNYKKTGNSLTKLLDALPGIQTKEPSTIMANAEFAQLIPGVNNRRVNNSSMIDDFEYARNTNDLSRQPNRWRLGSTPPSFLNNVGVKVGDEAYKYHFRRAKMSIYTVDMTTYFAGQSATGIIPPHLSEEARKNPFTANFNIQDILVGRSMPTFAEQVPTSILDISYFPSEPGMYNYNPNLNRDGLLASNPKSNFGSVMRGLTFDADFDNSNVEYLEFWMMNPFEGEIPLSNKVTNTTGGKLLFQLGDVSEDVIPDGRFNFENGIRPDSLNGKLANKPYIYTAWGKAPDVQFMVDAFENNETIRKVQDVGLDGLSNEEEREYVNPKDPSSKGIKGYLDEIRGKVTNAAAYQKIMKDPSKDDFRHFLDPSFENEQVTFIERYKDYLGIENNSPYNKDQAKADIVYANSNLIDKEDINQDNTINELEDFFEYEIDLKPDLKRGLSSSKFVVDSVQVGATSDRPETKWYLFRIPVRNPTRRFTDGQQVTPTADDSFKSIRFMRVVTTDWEQPVILRFATMQLVSNQYRVYKNKLNDTTSAYFETPLDPNTRTVLKSGTVSIEENGCPKGVNCASAKEYPYVVPPGFVRDVNYATQARMEFNEQSLSLDVENLEAGDDRAVFKNTQLDLNMYKRIKMFVHMHSNESNTDSLGVFLRIGTDLKNNYYEIEIPQLVKTNRGEISPTLIWREENEIDVPLEELRSLKLRRNKNSRTPSAFRQPYTERVKIDGTASGTEIPVIREYKISVKGNPDLSNVMTLMVGVRNNSKEERDFTIWANELRAFGFDTQDRGSAGLLSLDIKLADVGSLMLAGNFRNFGFGSVQDKISQRLREDTYSYGGALNLGLDKFFPLKWGLNIPFFVNYDKQVALPGFNPLDPDIRLDKALNSDNLNIYQENLTKSMVGDMTTTSGFNFMNAHKVKSGSNMKDHFYDIENFTFSYAQNRIYRSNVLMAQNDQSFTSAGITYQYSPKSTGWEPFKKATKLDSSLLKFLKPLRLGLMPSVISLKGYNEQVFYRTRYRDINLNTLPEVNLIKYYYGNRYYDLQWNLTQNISLTYNAVMKAIMDDFNGSTSAEQDVKFGSRIFSKGRAKDYRQNINARWRLPLQDIYILDWINASATFDNHFDFKSVAFAHTDTLKEYQYGHLIENGRDFGLEGRVDFVKLYNKIGFLRRANQPNQPRQRYTRAPGDEQDMATASGQFAKSLTRLLMAARGINGRFSLTESTLIPGFLETPDYFGLNSKSFAPGLPFVLGSQNSEKTIERIVENGWLSRNIQQFNPIVQKRGYNFEYSTNIEPFKDFRIVIKGNIQRTNDLSYVYQPDENNIFSKLAPVRGGSFKMSFWSFKSSFKKVNSDPLSGYDYEPFRKLQENRDKVIDILSKNDSFNSNQKNEKGNIKLSGNSQDILIPAFFAAYTGREVESLYAKKKFTRRSNTFNPFLGLPMPNWQINYQGLEKLAGFRALFSSITLSHSFVSSYSVGDFTSSLLYSDALQYMQILDFKTKDGKGYTLGSIENTLTNLLDPVYVMSSIVMEEKFAPFFGVNFTTKGSFTGNFAWNKDRMAMLNLSNAQVSEQHGNDFVFGLGMKRNKVVLPIRGRDGNNIVLPNDLIFRMDFSFRDLKLIQRKLDGDAIIKSGARTVQARPNIQYTFNKRLSMTMFWEKMINRPYVTQQYYSNNATFGVTARFNLTD